MKHHQNHPVLLHSSIGVAARDLYNEVKNLSPYAHDEEFADLMLDSMRGLQKLKLDAARDKNRLGWWELTKETEDGLRQNLNKALEEGDYVSVANYSSMLAMHQIMSSPAVVQAVSFKSEWITVGSVKQHYATVTDAEGNTFQFTYGESQGHDCRTWVLRGDDVFVFTVTTRHMKILVPLSLVTGSCVGSCVGSRGGEKSKCDKCAHRINYESSVKADNIVHLSTTPCTFSEYYYNREYWFQCREM